MSIKTKVVSGAARTGLYDPDGSINIVLAPVVTAPIGCMHPCGAWYVTVGTLGRYAADGSFKVTTSATTSLNGPIWVTAVS